MSRFTVGDSVLFVGSNEKGIIKDVFPPARGRQLYRVSINGEIKNCLESSIIPDLDLSNPFERLRQGIFNSYEDFSKINTSFKIENTSNNTISSLKASNTIFKAYQFKPLLKFLNSDNRRILIADEVGLGKTIEGGHIMLELMARKELNNSLIICPKSLQNKWQTELKEKFNLNFKIYESTSEFVQDIKDFGGSIKAIINYEKVRPNKKKRSDKPDLFKIIDQNSLRFDFVLCDEAHRLRNHTTQTYRGVKKIIDHTKSVVFLTATPIMISEQNLFNLFQLLDEHTYSEFSTFQNQLAVNAPFIKALTQVNNGAPLKNIGKELTDTSVSLYYTSGEEFQVEWKKSIKVHELFQEIPLYNKIIQDLMTKEDIAETRVHLQFDISDMSDMNKLFSRTRKKEVTQDWSQATREPHTLLIDLYPEERKIFDEVIEEYIEENSFYDTDGSKKMFLGTPLGLIQKKRQVASSVYGYLSNQKHPGKFLFNKDAKFEKLLEIINEVVTLSHKKLIVFALFKSTLKYLQGRLNNEGLNAELIHGGVENRTEAIENFRRNNQVQILLSSEVGSEGLDLQFCDALVNYDLPWNPMVVEQRIGRIDRFGQKSPVVNIYNLIVKDSIQEKIYTRLLDRIGIFRGSIGDLEAILDKDLELKDNTGVTNIRKWFSDLEKELYCTKLSQDQVKKKIDDIERAIITEQRNLEEISEGLTNTLTNDIHFRNEIRKIQDNYKYVTEKELVNYLKFLIREALPTCTLETIDEAKLIYNLILPKSSPHILINFLNRYQPHDVNSVDSFRRFINRIRGLGNMELTFSQEVGYDQPKLIRINTYHPIILAAFKFFDNQRSADANTFQFTLPRHLLGKKKFNIGTYFLAVYTSTFLKKWFNREQTTKLLIPLVYSVEEGKVIENTLAEELLGKAQLFATPVMNPDELLPDLISELEYHFALELEEVEHKNLEEQRMRIESHKKMQIQRKEEYYNNRIKTQENIVKSSENKLSVLDEGEKKNITNILPAQKKILMNLLEDKERILDELASTEISLLSPKLLSLSQIIIN
ncbi:hypothetical protein C7S20_05610 [Christiangramia fulva]|uniref:Helicase n=1 Tax=Christiangramia fulva TaxID=2126553 RepID=A0A2R3Z3E3_9FLAO|nr:SNF2-related protein [Christiangramia fulva]AVR44784.1 hypothetical protein C7S20_05610 [Christiangramia fulva]